MGKESKKRCCKLDTRARIAAVIAAVIIVTALVMILQSHGKHPKPVAECGDGICSAGETCQADCRNLSEVEKQYYELVDSCLEANHASESCMQLPVGAQYQQLCELTGGSFGYVGVRPLPQCVRSTPDAGKACIDDSDCVSVCLPDMTEDQWGRVMHGEVISGVTGTCAGADSDTLVGSRALIENGVVSGMIFGD
jgi:hypothetical protein